MPTLINDEAITDNPWRTIAKETDIAKVLKSPENQLIVPMVLWLEHQTPLSESGKEIGVWLESEDDPYQLSDTVNELDLIALNFPVFRDGRAFSAAAILRERLGFKGDLRAIGDVLRDQLYYMKQCGFNSYELSDSVKVEDALAAFSDFQTNYQSTVDNPSPLFRRR